MDLFKKHQKTLLAFANTNFGRSYIGHSGREAYDKYPIVKITRSGFIQLLGFNAKNQPILRLSTYPGSKQWGEIHEKLFGTILTKLEIADKYRVKDPKDLPFVIPHFMGETSRLLHKLPQIFLDVLTVNPATGSGGASVDGYNDRTVGGAGDTWANIIAGAGNDADSSATFLTVQIDSTSTSNQFGDCYRSKATYLTSALGAGATISAAVLSGYGSDKADGLSTTPNINVYASGGADNTCVNSDYEGMGSTAFSTAITYASWSTVAYNDFTLNANGITNISLTGVSKFGFRNVTYDVGATQPNWVSAQASYVRCNSADAASNLPKLVITYTPATTAGRKGSFYFM